MAPPAEPVQHLGDLQSRANDGSGTPTADAASPQSRSRLPLSSLQKRFLSAGILLPAALITLWIGDRVWAAFILAFALVMAWEWCAVCATRRMTQIPWPSGRLALPNIVAMATVFLALLPTFVPISLLPPAWFSLLVGVILVIGSAWPQRRSVSLWLGLGLLYVIPASLAAIAIRAQPGDGLSTEIWIVALVVAADTGAYVAGRSIGGPKLAPRISPNKTWAGLAGAILSAAVVGWITSLSLAQHTNWLLIIISGALALVEQAGDLFESFFKRYFGVKDSGRIIPGHGGVLDRVDGLMAVILAVAGLEFMMGGGILGWL